MTDLSAKDQALLGLREFGPSTARALGIHSNTLSRLRDEEFVRVAHKQSKSGSGRTAHVYALTRSGAARARKLAG
jgi:predicted ArsR family transcriptional regulator